MLDPVKLSNWLRMAMLSPKMPPIRQIVLQHTFASGEQQAARVWDWADGEVRPKVEELIGEINEAAETYANGRAEGTIRFMLEAYHGDSHQPWGTRLPFYIVSRSPEAESGVYGASEPATGPGLTAQLMRHLERREEMLNKTLDVTGKIQMKFMGDMQTRLATFEERHFDTIKLYEDLLDRRHERELAAVYRAREDERKSKAWNLAFSLAPVIASQVLSPKLAAALPGQVTDGGPAMQIIRELTKSLKEDQLPALASALSPEQLVMLMELHRMISSETEQKQQAEEQAKHIVPTSADDMRARRRQAEMAGEARRQRLQMHQEPEQAEDPSAEEAVMAEGEEVEPDDSDPSEE